MKSSGLLLMKKLYGSFSGRCWEQEGGQFVDSVHYLTDMQIEYYNIKKDLQCENNSPGFIKTLTIFLKSP